MDELRIEDPRYAAVKVTFIEENRQPELASQYDYYYVPTYYIDGVKVHEGIASKDIVRSVFEKALD